MGKAPARPANPGVCRKSYWASTVTSASLVTPAGERLLVAVTRIL
jgi:hypothetical protein